MIRRLVHDLKLQGCGAATAALLPALWTSTSTASTSSEELVRQAREHEAAHEEDVAARRYSEAIALDGQASNAWLGLGLLRLRMGEPAEAERVFESALARVPRLSAALAGLAHARWQLGRHAEAEEDLAAFGEAEHDPAAFRELASWFARDRCLPGQLGAWRRVLALANERGDAEASAPARTIVRALTALVDRADPVTAPADSSPARLALAAIGERAP